MKILCTTTFLDGTRRFEAGDSVTVSDEDGARFVAQGWASADGAVSVQGAAGSTDLDIQSGIHTHSVTNTVGG